MFGKSIAFKEKKPNMGETDSYLPTKFNFSCLQQIIAMFYTRGNCFWGFVVVFFNCNLKWHESYGRDIWEPLC